MCVSNKIRHISQYRESDIFRRESKSDKIFKGSKQVVEQKFVQMPDNGGKMRILQTKVREDTEFWVKMNGGVIPAIYFLFYFPEKSF